MYWKIRKTALIFNRQGDDTPVGVNEWVTTLSSSNNYILTETSKSPTGNWLSFTIPGITFGGPVWVRIADLVNFTIAAPLGLDLRAFVQYATAVSEDFASTQLARATPVSRNYILALSIVLNDFYATGVTAQATQSFDAFKFTTTEWDAYCKSAYNTKGYTAIDRFDPVAQIDAAVCFNYDDMCAIAHALPPSDPAIGPYVPNAMELFIVRMFGQVTGPTMLGDLGNNLGARLWSTYFSDAQVAALSNRYPRFLNAGGSHSLDDLVLALTGAFDGAFLVVSHIISDVLPEEAPSGSRPGVAVGKPPWTVVAQAEMDAGVKRPNARILDYLKAANYNGPVTTPWCAAFVSYCMEQANEDLPASARAWAATWGNWGRPLAPDWGGIPYGAVLVVAACSPHNEASHVTFYAGASTDGTRVLMLGGNQGLLHAVNVEAIPRSWVLHVRWPNDASVAAETPPLTEGQAPQLGAFTYQDWVTYSNAMAKRESGGQYWIVNQLGYCGKWQLGSAALSDLGYVRKGTRNSALGDSAVWTGKDGISSRDAFLSTPAAQDKAVLNYTRLNYNYLRNLNVVDGTTPVKQLGGYLAVAALVGAGGARDLKNGVNRQDANGVTASNYFAYVSGLL